MKNYIQIYTGDGKGKTTAALGLALRAAGRGLNIYIGQFMKGQHYGELDVLKQLSNIDIQQYGDTCCCIRRDEVTQKHVQQAHDGLGKVKQAMLSGKYDIVVLDEINVAIWFKVLSVDDVLSLIEQRPENVELILTGRKAPDELIAKADLVTEMKEIKHYYSQGVMARKGFEM